MTRLRPEGEPVETWGSGERPEGFVWQSVSHSILEVSNSWRVHTRWWAPGEVVWREYLKVVTDTGLLCLIYRDLPTGSWRLTRLYD
jgi:hypothetical protein